MPVPAKPAIFEFPQKQPPYITFAQGSGVMGQQEMPESASDASAPEPLDPLAPPWPATPPSLEPPWPPPEPPHSPSKQSREKSTEQAAPVNIAAPTISKRAANRTVPRS